MSRVINWQLEEFRKLIFVELKIIPFHLMESMLIAKMNYSTNGVMSKNIKSFEQRHSHAFSLCHSHTPPPATHTRKNENKSKELKLRMNKFNIAIKYGNIYNIKRGAGWGGQSGSSFYANVYMLQRIQREYCAEKSKSCKLDLLARSILNIDWYFQYGGINFPVACIFWYSIDIQPPPTKAFVTSELKCC